ncbi:MAG: hypothetical protein KJP07_00090 [Desulfatitalea sp.]|nr:hypothetical protein [Desulfatitalea sp.]
MKTIQSFAMFCLFVFLASPMTPACLWAEEGYKIPTVKELMDNKSFYDDPRPLYLSDDFNYKKILPPQVYAELSYDVETMKKLWAETVGFRAPDVVGKTAPEIKAGIYSYKKTEQCPGLKAIMTEYHYNRFRPGAPPFAGNFSEIKVIPTSQYYYSIPIAEATKKYIGKTMLNERTGFINESTYVAGYPFPRPEGKFKANQIYYNWLKRYWAWDSKYLLADSRGFTKSLREDNTMTIVNWMIKLKGRVMEPYGWFVSSDHFQR